MTIRKKRMKKRKNKQRLKHSNNRFAICARGAGYVSKCGVCLRKAGKTRYQQQIRDNKGNLPEYYQQQGGSNWN